ncbi:MAG: circadian clock KaiB family protein [Steroidobacteraceae bacterium]
MKRKSHSPPAPDVGAEFERALRARRAEKIELRLYVSGCTPRSARAIADFRRLCQEYFPGRCDVEIIDIYQQPELAVQAQIVAVPTLVKNAPAPFRRLIGSLAETTKVLKTLELAA